jgi:cytochrome c oxidase subunit 1
MAFARMNNFSFWLMIPAGADAGGLVLHARWRTRRRLDAVCPADAADGPVMDAGIFAMHIMGASSIMGSINIIVTILNMRAPA